MGPENFLGMGPEPECLLIGPEPECLLTGPELGPDRTDPLLCCEDEEVREVLIMEGSMSGMLNIFPSSPDFLMSPPVYGTARDAIVGCRSFCCCSGLPET